MFWSGTTEDILMAGLEVARLMRSGPNPPGSRRRKTTQFSPNGKREVARRLRQIAAGQLKVTA